MARIRGKACRLCRREGVKLFLKGARCETVKCSLNKREYPPGMRSWRRPSRSEYGLQLREKQKLKRFFGMTEKQFRRFFDMAERKKGNTGENLLSLVERRLDNVVYLLGFALSRRDARQIIAHGHIAVNGKRVDIPSYLVKVDDVISPVKRERDVNMIKARLETRKESNVPEWLEVNPDVPEGKVVRLPTAEDASLELNVQLVVELCSR